MRIQKIDDRANQTVYNREYTLLFGWIDRLLSIDIKRIKNNLLHLFCRLFFR